MTKRFLREKRAAVDGFLRAYVEALSYVKSQRDVTLKVIGKYTRQRDPEVLNKFYDDLVPDLPRMPYIEEASARATVDAMQLQGPPLPKVEIKTLFDNGLLKAIEAEGFLDKIKAP
jgi:hypothetical protein